jgi:competence protein ComEC
MAAALSLAILSVLLAPRSALRRAVLAMSAGVLLGFFSGRTAFVAADPPADVTCVGVLADSVLRGRCLSEKGWEWARVRIVPGLESPSERILSVSGRLLPPSLPSNTGALDWSRRSFLEGISGELHPLEKPVLVGVLGSPLVSLAWLKRRLSDNHRGLYGNTVEGAIVRSMTLGDRTELPEQVARAFRRSGLAHLLAISGFHVAVVGIAFHILIGGLLARTPLSPGATTWLRAGLTATAVSVFALVTGGAASTIRAASMAVLLLGRRVLGLPGRMLHHALFLAALVLVILSPASLFRPGLLLSFLAAFGLVSDVSRPGSIFLVTATAMVFTAPVLVAFFHQLAPVGLFSNPIGGPLASIILVGALFSQLMWPVFVLPAALLAGFTAFAAGLLGRLAGAFATAPPLLLPAALSLPLVACLVIGRLPGTSRGRLVLTAFAMLLVVLGGAVFRPLGPLQVDFLDVGQGDAIVVSLPSGGTVVIDAGGPGRGWLLSRMLSHEGVGSVSLGVVTHDHLDHVGGFPDLARSLAIEEVVSSALSDRVHVDRLVLAGDRLYPDKQVRIFVLGPEAGALDTNDRSVVLLLVYGSTSFLFLGDAESSSEKTLVQHWGPLLAADVVKVAHHGSSSSSGPFLVSRARKHGKKGWAIISVAANNRYGLPKRAALTAWQHQGFTVLTTSTYGAVTCTSNGVSVGCRGQLFR